MGVVSQTSAYTTHRMDDDGGVLGNLPRSRPGTRSQKRDAPERDAPARAARSAEKRGSRAARPSAQTRGRPAPPPPKQGGAADPVGGAVRTAAKVAGSGLKLANGVTRQVLRRLPKP
jgi:hypothetical protein